jgi:hypothetical protein
LSSDISFQFDVADRCQQDQALEQRLQQGSDVEDTAGNKTTKPQPGEKMAGSTRPRRLLSPSQQEPHLFNGIIAEVRAEDAGHAGMRATEELRAAA